MKSRSVLTSLAGLWMLCSVWASQALAFQLPDFTELVEQSAPAVVNISTVKNVQPFGADSNSGPFMPFDPDDPAFQEMPEIFRHFFFGQRGPQTPQQQRPQPRSLGSGFIISEDGYILTNRHVVNGADEIIVRLNDRRELTAELVGADARSDLALLKIKADNLPTVKVGRSRDLKVGEWVVAIGSPFGFDYSVTAGIVSAVGRSLSGDNYVPFIQTDVAINPGNSGGPLFNLDGQVVGINSQIYTRSGGFMGLSFAIPIDVAMEVAGQLRDDGHVKRGWLGVIIQEVNRDLAESFGLDKAAGALVAKVLPNSPAEKAGLREGDVITRFKGRDINLSAELPPLVGRVKPGDKAEVEVMRQGRKQTLSIEIGLLPDDETSILADNGQSANKGNVGSLNIMVADLSAEAKQRLRLEAGVEVRQVQPGPAASAGIQPGDVITLLNGEAVNSVKELQAVVKKLPKQRSVPVQIIRNGSPIFLPLRIE